MADKRSEQPKKRGTLCLLSRGNPNRKEPITLDLIRPTEKRVHKVNENVLRGVFGGVYEYGMVVGSTQGWIVFSDVETNTLKLINPFSGAHIQLPPLNSRVSRVFLSSDPCRSKDYTAVALHRSSNQEGDRMSFYKPGHDHNTWTSRTVGLEEFYHDFIYHNDKIFGLSRGSQELHVWDFSSVPTKVLIPTKVVDVESFEWHSVVIGGSGFVYLVESLGEILMVQRTVRGGDHYACTTIGFTVFKLDYSEKKWMRIQTLPAGRAILIKESGGSNICVSIQDMPELEENSIYFKENYCLGVYNLKEKKVRLLEYAKWDPQRCQDPILVVRKPWW